MSITFVFLPDRGPRTQFVAKSRADAQRIAAERFHDNPGSIWEAPTRATAVDGLNAYNCEGDPVSVSGNYVIVDEMHQLGRDFYRIAPAGNLLDDELVCAAEHWDEASEVATA